MRKGNIFRQKKNFPTDIAADSVRRGKTGQESISMEQDAPSELFRRGQDRSRKHSDGTR